MVKVIISKHLVYEASCQFTVLLNVTYTFIQNMHIIVVCELHAYYRSFISVNCMEYEVIDSYTFMTRFC